MSGMKGVTTGCWGDVAVGGVFMDGACSQRRLLIGNTFAAGMGVGGRRKVSVVDQGTCE